MSVTRCWSERTRSRDQFTSGDAQAEKKRILANN